MTTNQIMHVMPSQKLPTSAKNKEWGESCVTAIAYMGNTRITNGRTSWQRKQINYNLVNSIFDEDDLNYVLNPYGASDGKAVQQPAKMRDINLIVNKINVLKGEELARPFNYQVVATNGDAITAKEKLKRDAITQIAMQELADIMGETLDPVKDPNTGEEMPKTYEEVEKYANYSMKDIREKWGNDILDYLSYSEELQAKFNDGWEHVLIAAEEVYRAGIVNGEVKLRVVNPLNCEFDRNPDNPHIEDGDWFREDRWMTPGQILDEYGDSLTDEQLDMLDKGTIRQGLANQMYPGYGYTSKDIEKYERSGFASRGRASATHYLVKNVVWKSWKKIGFVSYPYNGETEENIVEEDFKLTKELKAAGVTVEWSWIPDVWEGTLIGSDIIVNVQPLANQIRSMDNPHKVKLPYIGYVYNGTNSVQTSIVDLIKPHQYLYNIIWFRLEAEIAKAKGKKFIMDLASIPKSHGINLDKWINMFDNVGIAFINSHEEGTGNAAGKVSQFNQYQAIDMTLSNSIGQYINILSKIEQLIDRMVGMPPQREGGGTTYETAHGVSVSQAQSSYVTEPLFYRHNNVKRKVLTSLVEMAKFAFKGKKRLNYMTDDLIRVATEIDTDAFASSDYDVFVSNSSRDNQIMMKLEGLAQAALNADKIAFSDIIKIYRSNNAVDIEKLIEKGEQTRQAQAEQAQQQQSQAQQAQTEALIKDKQDERAWKSSESQLDRENKLQVASISALKFDDDSNNNGIIDAAKQADLYLAESQHAFAMADKQLDRATQITEAEKDRALKREELRVKKAIEDKKAATALKNKVSGEK